MPSRVISVETGKWTMGMLSKEANQHGWFIFISHHPIPSRGKGKIHLMSLKGELSKGDLSVFVDIYAVAT